MTDLRKGDDMHSTITAENVSEVIRNGADGVEAFALYAVQDTDGRGRPVSDLFLIEAQTEDEARAMFTTARIRTLAERIDADGSIGGERLG